jgi:hypothetical protein
VTPTRPPTATVTPRKAEGDVNDDGAVNAVDALFILQYDARLLTSLPNVGSADTSRDGRINSVDASLVLQFTAGLIQAFPPG